MVSELVVDYRKSWSILILNSRKKEHLNLYLVENQTYLAEFAFKMSFFTLTLTNTHEIGRKEVNILFNDALNTYYLQLYGIIHMVEDHSDSDRGNPMPPHGLLPPVSSKWFCYMHHPTDRIICTTAFVTPVVEHWLERKIPTK